MSIWHDIGGYLTSLASGVFTTIADAVRAAMGIDAEQSRQVAFSIAIIALSAKMAKADGIVTEDEVEAFQQIFAVPPEEMGNVARLYNLAKQDTAGFEAYGRQVRALFPGEKETDADVLKDVLDALFHIAKADGVIHEGELAMLEGLADTFGFTPDEFHYIKVRHFQTCAEDAYCVLQASPDWDFDKLKATYRERVAENHPDRMIARGLPPEFVVLANERLAAINAAWEQIEAERKPVPAEVG